MRASSARIQAEDSAMSRRSSARSSRGKKVTLDHPIFTRWPAQYPDRLQLFSAPTPNGVKVANASDRSLASSACACSSSSIGSLLSSWALPTYSRYFSIALSRSRALKLVRVTPSDNLVHERAIGVQIGEVARRRHCSLALRQDREALGDGLRAEEQCRGRRRVKLGGRYFVCSVIHRPPIGRERPQRRFR